MKLNSTLSIGKNTFCCDRKIILGPISEYPMFFIIFSTMVLFLVMWSIFTCTLFIKNGQIYVFLIGFVLWVFFVYHFIRCFCQDPGIIPRNHPDFQRKDIKKNEGGEVDAKSEDKPFRNDAQSNQVLINNDLNLNTIKNEADNKALEVKLVEKQENSNKQQDAEKNLKEIEGASVPHIFLERDCRTCKITRPPKASHCMTCDNCVMGFDHHCYFIGNCVGLRNHINFYLFLFFGMLFSLHLCATSLAHTILIFKQNDHNLIENIKGYYPGLIVAGSLVCLAVFMLIVRCNEILLNVTGGIALVVYIVIFYLAKDSKAGIEINPFSGVLFISALPFVMFILFHFCNQCNLVSKGINTKVLKSIEDHQKKSVDVGVSRSALYNQNISFSQQVTNFCTFLTREREESLVFKALENN